MKRTVRKKTISLIGIGLFVIATSQIISRYVEMQDFVKGSLVGIGLGMLLLAVIFGKFKTVR